MANPEHLAILKQGVKVWNEWREKNPNVTPDLTSANLNGAYLMEVNLSRANLNGASLIDAKLIDAKLIDAKLIDANLSKANLSKADLRGANLDDADLNDANFSYTDLALAHLNGAHLEETLFSQARMGWTVLGHIDLSTARGLDTVEHAGPSTIGIDTLYLSEGNIPEVFLRSAGVADEIITLQYILRGRRMEFYSCFISYSHADKNFASQLYDALQGRGIQCWLDEHQMLPGDDIYEQIDRGIRMWDKVLLCCSRNSLMSWWVDNEIERVFKKERELMKERGTKVRALIPLNLDGYMFKDDWTDAKATTVKSRLAADFRGWKRNNARFEAQLERVVRALRTGDGGRKEPPKPQL